MCKGGINLSDHKEAKSFNIWEGVYESFQAAKKEVCGQVFNGDIYLKRTLAAANECLDSLNNHKPIPQFHKQRSNLLPPIVALYGGQKLRILDFGGGLGIGYMTLLESIPEAVNKIRYTIVEIPEVCELGEQVHGKGGRISFISSIPLCASFDIVHAASSMQYIENWEDWVSAIASLMPNYILLSDVFAGEIDSFVTLQYYYGFRIPHWFLSLKDLLSAFDACGYQLIMKSSVTSRRLNQHDVLPMDNFPAPLRLQESLHLLFKTKIHPSE